MIDDVSEQASTTELRREIRELREDLTLLRLAQDRLANISMLNAALPSRGIIGYDGPVRFDLPYAIICEHCGSPIDGMGYEIRLPRGRAHLCKGCFDETTREVTII